ncbi:MAG TPA: hypothetical protein VFA23_01225 [Dongiaceae bacterium]|nr:hypothetical protein [Dongiaceae bacterium]
MDASKAKHRPPARALPARQTPPEPRSAAESPVLPRLDFHALMRRVEAEVYDVA